jgi:hypothetical protein
VSHMVIYRGTDGKPGYHQTDDIHDAVSFVEQLRNDNGVEHARIFRLEEVSFEYRPYFRVELKAGDPAVAAAPIVPAMAAAPAPLETPAAAPVIETVSAPVVEETVKAPTFENVVDEVKTEAAAPVITTPAAGAEESAPDGENGVGARRGLFGR